MSNQKTLQELSFIKSTSTHREFWVSHTAIDFPSSVSTGKKMAIEYFQYLQSDCTAPILASIVCEIAKQSSQQTLDQGQIIGFFATIEEILKAERAKNAF